MACLTALVATYKDTTTDAITAAFISAPPSSTIVIIWFRRGNFHPLGGIFYVPLLFLRRVIAEYECITPYAKCMPSSNLANPVNVHKLLLDIVLFFFFCIPFELVNRNLNEREGGKIKREALVLLKMVPCVLLLAIVLYEVKLPSRDGEAWLWDRVATHCC